MGLIDLKTDLKSLKYGNDKRGGGSSNQPYITTPIPDGFAPTSPDFLLRNGYLNPVSSLRDVSRLTKWFTDTKSPNGILFTAKQQLLERQNVKIPGGFNRVYNPLGTIAQAGVLSTGYHLNKQGLNPFARGYFSGGREGYYYPTLAGSNVDGGVNGGENRLTLLYTSKIVAQSLNTFTINPFGISGPDNQVNLLSYSGGPGSTLGIGNTNIRFTGTGPRERTNNEIVLSDAQNIFRRFGNEGSIPNEPPVGQIKANKSTLLSYLNQTYNPKISNFNREDTYLTAATSYKKDFSTNPFDLVLKIDKLNVLPNLNPTEADKVKNSDLVKFYFEVINNNIIGDTNNTFLFFRAYLNNFSDGFKAEWQSYKYVGRGENFYKYSGFSRDISLSFTIYAHSRAEMIPIYQKLNTLVGTTAPDYSNIGLMRGNFIKMTVGDYLLDVPGIIQNINLKPSFEAGWDINRDENGNTIAYRDEEGEIITSNNFVGQLPRLIEVDLQFTPIHTFTPQIGENFIRNI
jgi:hypothetical protein